MTMNRDKDVGRARAVLAGCGLCALMAFTAAVRAADTCNVSGADSTTSAASLTAQRLLQALISTNGVPGMGAALGQGDQVLWTGCAGYRDLEAEAPVRRDTVFRLASVSKLIAATAAAKLSEEGRLDLDAPVGETLDWLPPAWRAPTPRQLAAHIAGAPHYIAEDFSALGDTHFATGRDAVGHFSDRALLSPPGTAYHYSSWGYTVLGTVIEARSGLHFLDYLRAQVILGLAIDADGSSPSQESALYDIDRGPARRIPRTDMSYTWGGGGLAATPEALVHFGSRLMAEGIVSGETWQAMLQPARLADGAPVRDRDYEVGLGWRVGTDADGVRIAHHAGVTAGARSVLLLWPGERIAVSVLSNASWISSIESTAQVLAAPFRAAPAGLVANACPVSGRMSASLKGETFEVDAGFRLEEGRCVGEIEAAEPLRAHFKSAYQWPDQRLSVIAMDADGRLARAGLATPYGLYDLRATGPGRWSAALGSSVTLELVMIGAEAGQ
jgi:CubicO group peptidase (beta-lactamase class C family)